MSVSVDPEDSKLSCIVFKNYRSFAGNTIVKVAPITLLYGRNSVGKSAITDVISLWNELTRPHSLRPINFNQELISRLQASKHKSSKGQDLDDRLSIGAGFKVGRNANWLINEHLTRRSKFEDKNDPGFTDVRQTLSALVGKDVLLELTFGWDSGLPSELCVSIDGEKLFTFTDDVSWCFPHESIVKMIRSDDPVTNYNYEDSATTVIGKFTLHQGVKKFRSIFPELFGAYEYFIDHRRDFISLLESFHSLRELRASCEREFKEKILAAKRDKLDESVREKLVSDYLEQEKELDAKALEIPVSPFSSLIRRSEDDLVFSGIDIFREHGMLGSDYTTTSETYEGMGPGHEYMINEDDFKNICLTEEGLEFGLENIDGEMQNDRYHLESVKDLKHEATCVDDTMSNVMDLIRALFQISHGVTKVTIVEGSRTTLSDDKLTLTHWVDPTSERPNLAPSDWTHRYLLQDIRDKTRLGWIGSPNLDVNPKWIRREFSRITRSSLTYELQTRIHKLFKAEEEVPTRFSETKMESRYNREEYSDSSRLKLEGYRAELTLRSPGTGTLDFSEVGDSISCLFEVLASLSAPEPTVVQQPELHLHPQVQLELADSLVDSATTSNALRIWETHSEHILIRVLRRLRESQPAHSLNSNHVQIYYVTRESGDPGSVAQQIRLTSTGDFIDQWPHGFFNERFEEYFPE